MAQEEPKKDSVPKKRNVSKENKDPSKPKEKPPSKVVIRRLPPTMTEEIFLEQISPIPENDLFYYVKGEHHVGVPTFSRAYINFINQEEIFTFQDKFDGYVFLDQRGTEYTAVVEFAPYQKIPRQQENKEDKCNTLDSDPHYLEFLEKLENPEEIVLQTAESYLEQLEQKERDLKANGSTKVTTPLVEFIHQRRLEREKYREEKKEERRRKEMDKKKSRDVERMKKRDVRKEKDERKGDKSSKEVNKIKKEDDRPPIKVLKNIEREAAERLVEKTDRFEGGAVKKSKETIRSKDKLNKEKATKERAKKVFIEKKLVEDNDDGVESRDAAVINPKKHVRQTVREDTHHKEDSPSGLPNRNEEDLGKSTADRETDRDKERRIRNKDRPAIQIYRPGSKRLTSQKPEGSESTGETKREVKTRTFTRSAGKD